MWNALLPNQAVNDDPGFRGFGSMLSPVNFRRGPARLVSYYALFK